MSMSRAPKVIGWVVAVIVGCAATWASAAFGLGVAAYVHCRFQASPLPAPAPVPPPPPVAVAPEPPPVVAPPEPESDEGSDEPLEIYERPSINLHCGDARYLAIRRSAIAYCRKHPDDRGSYVCPYIIKQLRRCPRNGVPLSLACPSQPAGKDKPDCDNADAWMDPIEGQEEIIPYLEVVHEHGRWSVIDVGYDDMERP